MPVSGMFRVTVGFTAVGVEMSTGFHLHNDTAVDDVFLAAAAAQLATAGAGTFRNTFAAVLTTGDTLTSITCEQTPDPNVPGDLTLQASETLAIGGTRALGSNSLPPELTATLTLQTPVSSRRARGRMFMPPPRDQGALAVTTWASSHAYWTSIVAFAAALENLLAGSGTHLAGTLTNSDLVIWSKAEFLRSETPGFVVTNVRPNLKQHWLRSRAT